MKSSPQGIIPAAIQKVDPDNAIPWGKIHNHTFEYKPRFSWRTGLMGCPNGGRGGHGLVPAGALRCAWDYLAPSPLTDQTSATLPSTYSNHSYAWMGGINVPNSIDSFMLRFRRKIRHTFLFVKYDLFEDRKISILEIAIPHCFRESPPHEKHLRLLMTAFLFVCPNLCQKVNFMFLTVILLVIYYLYHDIQCVNFAVGIGERVKGSDHVEISEITFSTLEDSANYGTNTVEKVYMWRNGTFNWEGNE